MCSKTKHASTRGKSFLVLVEQHARIPPTISFFFSVYIQYIPVYLLTSSLLHPWL